ncbi:MAG: GNAT family N-acetyltransferase [Cyclobacteriaceae bacterium]
MEKVLKSKSTVKLIDFQEAYTADFARLNYEWLEKHFTVEPHDREMLDYPIESIINTGGQIFFAKYENEIVGTAALVEEDKDTFELAKMGVTTKYQGLKIGYKLILYAIEKAKQAGKKKLVLESCRKLVPAVNLYKKVGFVEVAHTGCSPYTRCDIRMSLDI